MSFLELKNKFKDQIVFTSNDAKKIDEDFDLRRLTEWQKKGYIKKIIKGFYIFSDIELTEKILFSIANKIYSPSYISLESALRYYNLIPEGVFEITSVSTKKTSNFDTKIGKFNYRKIKSPIFFGYNIQGEGKKKFKIADIEKVIVDFFYLNTEISDKESINSLRFNKEVFDKQVNLAKLKNYLKKVNNKNLTKRVETLLETINA